MTADMTTQIARLSIRLDARHPAYRSVGRTTLAELGRRQQADQVAWLNCYLLAPSPDPAGVSGEAIDLIKYLVGCAYHFQPQVMRRIVADSAEGGRLLLEAEGSALIVEHAPNDVRDLLTQPRLENDPWESLQQPARILLDYQPAGHGNTQIVVDAVGRAMQKLALAYIGTLPRGGDDRFSLNTALQTQILKRSVSAAEAVRRSHAKTSDVSSWASRRRHDNRLFGVWLSPARTFVHPDFQFSAEGIHPKLPELLAVLRTRAGFGADRGGWRRACWLYQRDRRLADHGTALDAARPAADATVVPVLGAASEVGRTPAEVFAHEPDRVITLARTLPAPCGNNTLTLRTARGRT